MRRLILLCGVLAVAPVAAQTRLVNLNVVAMDSHGQPVAGLTREDFQVTDSGKEQQIAFFRFQGEKSAAPISHATTIVFDLLNGGITDRGFATDEIVHTLQGRETSDTLFLYLLTREGKLLPVHALPASLGDVRPAAEPWTKRIRPLLDEALKNANRLRPGGLVDDVRIRMTYDALAAMVSAMSGIPGRKNIVWISRGVPISLRLEAGGDALDYRPMAHRFAEAARQAKVTVYPVNPSASATPAESELSSVETLQQIANLTGGRLFVANNQEKAIAQATEEWRGSYSVGYVPPAENWDGKFHKVRVTSSRKGVVLQAPDGYDAPRQDTALVDRQRTALQMAVSSPFDSPEIGLKVSVTPSGLVIRVPYGDAFVTAQGNRYTAHFLATTVDYTSKGPKTVASPNALDVTMTEEQRNTAMKDGIALRVDRAIPPDIERVRAIVYDPATNLLGSATVPVK